MKQSVNNGNSSEASEEIDFHLEVLAKDLALNHVRNSLIDSDVEYESKIGRILEGEGIYVDSSSRNVVILGSGTSHSAYPAIFPLGLKSVELIEKKLQFDLIKNQSDENNVQNFQTRLQKKYLSIKEKLELIPNSKDGGFETRMAVMSHFFESNEIRNQIALLFDYSTFPSYFYEVIAHLLKNRFIEGVINFNFDELMDQAIDEELGSGHLIKVISDGDCLPYSEMLTFYKLREPFYIKPHGTASHKSTLRFTKEQYLDIPNEIEELMEEIFVGKTLYSDVTTSPIDENKNFRKLNLLVFGFAMESLEFNAVLRRAFRALTEPIRKGDVPEKQVRIYYFSYEERIPTKADANKTYLDAEEERIRKDLQIFLTKNSTSSKSISLHIICLHELANLSNSDNPLDFCVSKLADMVYGNFNKIYQPSRMTRHQLMTNVFDKARLEDVELLKRIEGLDKIEDLMSIYENSLDATYLKIKKELYFASKDYFRERVIFEIILVVLKNKGYIQPKESLKGINRVGNFYHLYYQSFVDTSDAESIHTILASMGLTCSAKAHSNQIYFLEEFYKFNSEGANCVLEKWAQRVEELAANESSLYRVKADICSDTVSIIERIINWDQESVISKDSRILNYINRDSLSLYPNYRDYRLNSFGHIDPVNIIPTTTALKFRFLDFFLNKEWTTLLVTTDRGNELLFALEEFYSESREKKSQQVLNKNIVLILADVENTRFTEIMEFDRNDEAATRKGYVHFSIEILKLPFYDHNSHISMFLSEDIAKGNLHSPVNTIYYYKKGFSNNINAVHLRSVYNEKNNLIIWERFLCYYYKAICYNFDSTILLHIECFDTLEKILFNNVPNSDNKAYSTIKDYKGHHDYRLHRRFEEYRKYVKAKDVESAKPIN